MKILVDQNISFRIISRLIDVYEGLAHVGSIGLEDQPDAYIFEFAKKDGYDAIITMDEDFNNLVIAKGIPPKIIWLRTGNCRVSFQAELLLSKFNDIQDFLEDAELEVLELYS